MITDDQLFVYNLVEHLRILSHFVDVFPKKFLLNMYNMGSLECRSLAFGNFLD